MFVNGGDTPYSAVSDGVNVNVNAVNDAPVVTITPASFGPVDEHATLDLKNTGMSVVDIDALCATVTATLSAVSGQAVTVDLGFTGTATNVSDYTRSATSMTTSP